MFYLVGCRAHYVFYTAMLHEVEVGASVTRAGGGAMVNILV